MCNKYEIIRRIENFAPVESQEEWDASGWIIDLQKKSIVNKVILCLTVTDNVVSQARKSKCDLIISHHPCFSVPLKWYGIDIYSAHTNLDKAIGGTTDTLIESLGLSDYKQNIDHDFLRFVDYSFSVEEFNNLIKNISKNARIINNCDVKNIHKIAFCAGSGSEFIDKAKELGADCFVTGDLKFHTAIDSDILIYDIGHFESEIGVLKVFEKLIAGSVEVIYANEKSPFSTL